MKRVVAVVQLVAVLAALLFVVMLFANEPDDRGGGGARPAAAAGTAAGGAPAVDGEAVYSNRCASCHGADGGGSLGPQLSDGKVVARFPDIADQITVITEGRGGMPSFGDRLSAAEIRAVAEYERSL